MKAVILSAANGPESIAVEEVPTPDPAAGEVRVKLVASALNRRDYWMTKGLYPGMQFPCRPGSDGSGVVDAVGSGVDEGLIGKEVVVYPARQWGDQWQAPGPTFRVLGMPDDGTFAEYICTPADTVYDKPAHLSHEQAAAVPLAGLTSWRAVTTHAEVERGQQVLITGAGGGVATFAILWCLSKGADVYVSSGSEQKIAAAKALGATAGADYHDDQCYKELKKLAGGFHAIIDSAGGDAVNAMIDTLRPAGRYVFFGSTMGNPSKGLPMPKLFFKQVRIQGTTMGSQPEFEAMLDWAGGKKIEPVVDRVLPLADAREAFEVMEGMSHSGKIVLNHA